MGRRDSLSLRTEESFQKREGGVNGITFDAGGLIALDRNDRRVLTLVARATERGMRITIPATALAQGMRNPARQARLRRLIRQAGTDLIPLEGPDATAGGLLLGRAGESLRSCSWWSSDKPLADRALGDWPQTARCAVTAGICSFVKLHAGEQVLGTAASGGLPTRRRMPSCPTQNVWPMEKKY